MQEVEDEQLYENTDVVETLQRYKPVAKEEHPVYLAMEEDEDQLDYELIDESAMTPAGYEYDQEEDYFAIGAYVQPLYCIIYYIIHLIFVETY